MKTSDHAILGILALAALVIGFWIMILSPKRQEAADLNDEVTQLERSIEEQEQIATFAEQARQDFPKYYGKLVVLGKAVPEQADSASLLVQLSDVSQGADVEFRGIKVAEGAASAPAARPVAPLEAAQSPSATDAPVEGTATPTEGTTTPTEGTTTTAAPTTTAIPATEATASTLPIGASVGPAGLPIVPYELSLRGRFFDMSDFIAGVDELVGLKDEGQVAADGRLLTIDGFAFVQDKALGFPSLEGSFLVTAYTTPATQGLTAGATSTAPASVPAATATSTVSTGVTP